MSQNREKSNSYNQQIDAEYPQVVQDHKDKILTHNQKAQHDYKKPSVVFNEEDEEGFSQNKQLPHLKFVKDQNQDIGFKIGIKDRQSQQYEHLEDHLKTRQSVLQEANEEDEEEKEKKKLPHIDFPNDTKYTYGYVGKKLISPRQKSNSFNSREDLQEIKENKKEEYGIVSPSRENIKLHQSLQKIDKELSKLEKDNEKSPTKLKRQKSINTDIEESIKETEEFYMEEEKQQGHKNNQLGHKLTKLEKTLDTAQQADEVSIREHSRSKSNTRKGTYVYQQEEEPIQEDQHENDEEQQ